MKNQCPIVKDLLPSYIDELTSSETNQFIQTHLNSCKECNQVFKEFSSTLEPVDTGFTNKKAAYELDIIQRIQKRNYRIIIFSIIIGASLGMYTLTSFKINTFFLLMWVYPFISILLGSISSLILRNVWVAPIIILLITSISSFILHLNGFWFWVLVYFVFTLGGSLLGLYIRWLIEKSKGRLG